MQTEDSQHLLGLNLAHNIGGANARRKLPIKSVTYDNDRGDQIVTIEMITDPGLSLSDIRRIYEEEQEQVIPGARSMVYNALGNKPETFKLYYTRVELPQEGELFNGKPLEKVRVVALTDGVDGHASKQAMMNALKMGNGPLKESQRLVNLVHDKDPDDRLVVVGRVQLAPQKN